MVAEFRHGPKDGEKIFLPIGKGSETILVDIEGKVYLYRKTERLTKDGSTLYQCVGPVQLVAA